MFPVVPITFLHVLKVNLTRFVFVLVTSSTVQAVECVETSFCWRTSQLAEAKVPSVTKRAMRRKTLIDGEVQWRIFG